MITQAGKQVNVGDEVMVVQRFVVEEIKTDKSGTKLMGWKKIGDNNVMINAMLTDVEDVYGASQAAS